MKICITIAAVCSLAVGALAAPKTQVTATSNWDDDHHHHHNPVPEPISLVVLGVGAGLIALRKKK